MKFKFQGLLLEVKPNEYLYIGENDFWSLRIGSIEDVNTRGICTKYKYGLGGYGIGKINPTFAFNPEEGKTLIRIWEDEYISRNHISHPITEELTSKNVFRKEVKSTIFSKKLLIN